MTEAQRTLFDELVPRAPMWGTILADRKNLPQYIDREELGQIARLAMWEAARKWRPGGRMSYEQFAWMIFRRRAVDWLRDEAMMFRWSRWHKMRPETVSPFMNINPTMHNFGWNLPIQTYYRPFNY